MNTARGDANDAADERHLANARRMEALGRMAGGIAHDFNNLLTSIRGLGALALEELEPDHPLRPDLEEILKAAQRATEMTSDLLAFSGRQRIEAGAVDVNALVEDVARRARALDDAIDLHVTTDRAIPPVAADPEKLALAVENLVSSAARASDGKPVHVETVVVRLALDAVAPLPAGDYAVIRVTDDGRVDRDQIDALFEPFAAPRSTEKGTGLALAVAYGIVRRAGGLVVASADGDRLTISAFLPIASGDRPA